MPTARLQLYPGTDRKLEDRERRVLGMPSGLWLYRTPGGEFGLRTSRKGVDTGLLTLAQFAALVAYHEGVANGSRK